MLYKYIHDEQYEYFGLAVNVSLFDNEQVQQSCMGFSDLQPIQTFPAVSADISVPYDKMEKRLGWWSDSCAVIMTLTEPLTKSFMWLNWT